MTITFNKVLTGIFVLFFLAVAWLSAYRQEPLLLFIPLALPAVVFLIQYPMVLFYILLITIPWSIEYNFSAALGTDLPDEPLMLLTALAAIILLITGKNLKSYTERIHPLLFLVLLQFSWSVVAVVNSTDVVVSVKYLLAKSWYLLSFVVVPLYLFRDEKLLKKSAILLFISMFAFTILAQVKHAQYGFSFEKINDALAPFYRNHVNYSALLVCTLPIQMAILRLSSSRFLKILIWGTLLISLFALYFSFARGAWLALVTGVSVYFLIRKKLITWVFSLFFIFIFGAVVWLRTNDQYLRYAHDFNTTIWHENFREHLIATYKLKDASTAERFYRWIAGVRMAEDKWAAGFGPSTFYKNYKSYTIPAFKTWVSKNKEQSTVHNYFLLMLIEQGAPGLVIFLACGFLLFWYAQKIYHRTDDPFWKIVSVTAASILVMIFTVNFLSDLIETDKIGSVFYLCLATLVVADVKTRTEKAVRHEL